MEIPHYDADPVTIVDWIRETGFPLSSSEKNLLAFVQSTRYTQELISTYSLYELRVLYWQVVGWLRR